MSALLGLDEAVEKLESSLPDALNWSSETPAGPPAILNILRRQRNVLRARRLHLRVLLYRPSFSLHCSSLRRMHTRSDPSALSGEENTSAWENRTLTSSIRKRCATFCVKVTCELAKAIELGTMEDATGAWWFGMFCKWPIMRVFSDRFPKPRLTRYSRSYYLWWYCHSCRMCSVE